MLLLLDQQVWLQMPVVEHLLQRAIPKVVPHQMLVLKFLIQSYQWVLIQTTVLKLWSQRRLTVIRILLTKRQMLKARPIMRCY